jgi:HPt (histidine-containing phosphotransfer) domain-containing protein
MSEAVGEENVRQLVRTFLRDFPASVSQLSGGERRNRHRLVHSMKGSSRVVGAHALSQRLAEIEERLAEAAAPDLTPQEIDRIAAEFEAVARPLRAFVEP